MSDRESLWLANKYWKKHSRWPFMHCLCIFLFTPKRFDCPTQSGNNNFQSFMTKSLLFWLFKIFFNQVMEPKHVLNKRNFTNYNGL